MFKVGDTVYSEIFGLKGKVALIINSGVLVEFGDKFNGHNGGKVAKEHGVILNGEHCWWLAHSELKKVEEDIKNPVSDMVFVKKLAGIDVEEWIGLKLILKMHGIEINQEGKKRLSLILELCNRMAEEIKRG